MRAFHSPSPSTARQGIACDVPRGGCDPGCLDQQLQRTCPSAIGDGDVQSLLAATQGAEVWHLPVKAFQPQQAFDKPGRLAKRHAELARGSARSGLKTVHWTVFPAPFTLHSETNLDHRIAELVLTPPLAGRWGIPIHIGIKPTSRDIAVQCPAPCPAAHLKDV